MLEDRLNALKGLFTHASGDAAFELWLVKRRDDDDANRKDLDEFIKTARELGIAVSPEPLDFPTCYILSIKATLKVLASLTETKSVARCIVDIVPRQEITML